MLNPTEIAEWLLNTVFECLQTFNLFCTPFLRQKMTALFSNEINQAVTAGERCWALLPFPTGVETSADGSSRSHGAPGTAKDAQPSVAGGSTCHGQPTNGL